MRIVDISPSNEQAYCMCLEEWSDEIREAGDRKRQWYEAMKGRGLRVKLAEDDNGNVGGMIHYVPIEQSFAEGKDLYFVLCIWVHGYKEGRGNFQKRGMGTMLLKAAEEDARALGAKGLVCWGLSLPVFMRASWFKRHGYRTADRLGMQALLWKPFTDDAVPPRWIRRKKTPTAVPGKVTVDLFTNGWCPAQNLARERALRAAKEHGDKALVREYDTLQRDVFLEWGISDAVFIGKKEVRTGPPPSYEKIRRIMRKKARRLG